MLIYQQKNETENLVRKVSQNVKYCSTCGNVVTPGRSYCESCGTKIEEKVRYNAAPPRPQYVTVESGDRYKGYLTIIGVIDILLGLPAMFIGVLLLFADIAILSPQGANEIYHISKGLHEPVKTVYNY